MLGFIAQSLRVALAYIAACIGVGLFGALAVANSAGLWDRPGPDLTIQMTLFGFQVAVMAGSLAFYPALIAILLAEFTRITSIVYFLLVGLVIAILPSVPFERLTGAVPRSSEPNLVTFNIACGFVGALVYWVAAGRWSGNWREPGGRL